MAWKFNPFTGTFDQVGRTIASLDAAETHLTCVRLTGEARYRVSDGRIVRIIFDQSNYRTVQTGGLTEVKVE